LIFTQRLADPFRHFGSNAFFVRGRNQGRNKSGAAAQNRRGKAEIVNKPSARRVFRPTMMGAITTHLSPITNHQSPITNHQSPITNHQSQTVRS